MLDEIGSMLGQMFMLLFGGIISLFKTVGKENVNFLRQNPRFLFIIPILFLATFLRFQSIAQTHNLQIHPEDIKIAHTHLEGTITLLGGKIWPGDFALGPFYNYLFEPTFVFGNMDPVGPANLAGFFFVATVLLVYLVGRRFFSVQAGLFASALYAIAPQIYSYSNKTWTADILPFFVLLFIFVLFSAAASARSFLLYLISGFLLGICLQLHFAAVSLIVVGFLYMIIVEWHVRTISPIRQSAKNFGAMVIGLAICLLPFLYYEITHQFINTQHITLYFFQMAKSAGLMNYLLFLPSDIFMLFARLTLHYPTADVAAHFTALQLLWLTFFVGLVGTASLVTVFFVRNKFILLLLGLWLVFGLLLFSLVRQDIPAYHFTLLYPVFALLVGNLFGSFYHLMGQDRIKMAKQLISHTAESETYTMIPVDVTDSKKLFAHRLCIIMSVLIFLLVCILQMLLRTSN